MHARPAASCRRGPLDKTEMGQKKVKAEHVTPGMKKAESRSARVMTLDIECPVTKKDAAEILGISCDTLDQWTVRYGIPHIKYDMDGNRGNRGKVLYLPSDLIEFRDKFRVEGRDIAREVGEMIKEGGDSG